MLNVIEKADHVAFLYCYYSMAQGRDEKSLMNWCKRYAGYKNDRMIQYCIRKFGYKDMKFSELTSIFKERKYKYPASQQVVICHSCHYGTSSTTDEEIETQIGKYKKFICESCEQTALAIGRGDHSQYLITKNGVYVDEGARKKGTPFLGFGGSWNLLRKNDRCWITNNLFVKRSFANDLLPLFENKINTQISYFCNLEDLTKLVSNEELEEIQNSQAYKYFCA